MHEKGMTKNMIIHPIPPVYDKNSKILILGSFPSVKSREEGFFYGHPHNQGEFLHQNTKINSVCLPSTSPANAAYSLEKLIDTWKIIRC